MQIPILNDLRISLDRTVPISDPLYIIGEDKSLSQFKTWIEDIKHGITGSVILAQIGNGKTHFLRYTRNFYRDKYGMVGIYIPDMFVNGPLVNSLNSIYKSFFAGPGNYPLKMYYTLWENFLQNNSDKLDILSSNEIVRYLLNCSNQEEAELVLDYFSNIDLFPDQSKFLRAKFGIKKNFITNENDFSKASADALEFIQVMTGQKVLIFIDEVDKVYSSETNKVCLTKVGLKILSAYRTMFDYLNARNIKGLICIGATPDAWSVLSWQTAFERRFKDHKIMLKVPKSKEDCLEFIKKRLEEIHHECTKSDELILRELINNLSEDEMKTWADVISALKSPHRDEHTKIETFSPTDEILDILQNSIIPLTWSEIISKSSKLEELYQKSQPTQILKKLEKDGRLKINPTQPLTYESVAGSEELLNG